MLLRRDVLRALASMTLLGTASAAYGVVEPLLGLRVVRHTLTPPGWTPELSLRLAIIADPHACDPWMSVARLDGIVDVANDLGADCVLLLGDYIATHKFQTPLPHRLWAGALARLRAPLGVHAILGNHDWWADDDAIRHGRFPAAGKALQDAGVPVWQNRAIRLAKDGRPFWLAGLGDQLAYVPYLGRRHPHPGVDDLPLTLAHVTDDAPVLLMAHEPDIFPRVPARVSLTLSGHTHGGQINLLGWTPVVPSRYGSRYVRGHKVEGGRHLLVSSGLGCSGFPARVGVPPEIIVIDLGAPTPIG